MLERSLLVLVLLHSMHWTVMAQTTRPDQDVKPYSYICLQSSQDLCLGISPGETDPFYNPKAPPYQLQLKQRLNNEEQALDYKKTRWDVRFSENLISLSRFSDMCISLQNAGRDKNELALYPCDDVVAKTRAGLWDMGFNNNINEMSEIRLLNDSVCVTAMACNSGTSGYCDPESEEVATKFRTGGYVKTKACWWTPSGDRAWKSAQTFVQALDCAVGCSPMLLYNNVCDIACANSRCNLDNGKCVTAAPTPDTLSPSQSPTTPQPTTNRPSSSPTSEAPTTSPTPKPTKLPTSQAPSSAPTRKPSKSPITFAPSHSPNRHPTDKPTSQAPTKRPTTLKPSSSPTVSPTAEPTSSPSFTAPSTSPSAAPVFVPILKADPPTAGDEPMNAAAVVGVAVPSLLFLLLCLVGFVVLRQRKKRVKRDLTAWNSPIDVNQAAFVEHHRNMKPTLWQRATAPFRRARAEPSAITALSSAQFPVDDIVVVGAPSWQPSTARPNGRKPRRPKLTGT